MKIIFTLVLINCFCIQALCQNIEDAYDPDLSGIKWWEYGPIPPYFEGEYQIFLDNLFWKFDDNFSANAVTLSLEIVSYPFVPEFFIDNNPNKDPEISDYRTFNTKVASEYDHDSVSLPNGNNYAPSHEGLGWTHGDYTIFSKLFNTNECKGSPLENCHGDYTLLSSAFFDSGYAETQCLLPHTVIKHSLFLHCGPLPTDPVVDTISWIYDNTRGEMRRYPFMDPLVRNSDDSQLLDNSIIDVAFRPTFHNFSFPNTLPYVASLPDYGYYYDSGIDTSSGPIDYFPPEEVIPNFGICDKFDLYYSDDNPQEGFFLSDWENNEHKATYAHPPHYALLDAPLLNVNLDYYAGYNSSGDKMPGKVHKYYIKESFDLNVINPTEKIIYNPSEVEIQDDLTFPFGYKFLTLHGKYPDISELEDGEYPPSYWDEIPCFEFKYDNDYPVPINPSTNSTPVSYYILDRCVLTIEPYVIIMDAQFSGTDANDKSVIRLDTNHTYGNWTYDTATVRLVPLLYTFENCVPFAIENNGNQIKTSTETKYTPVSLLKIFRSGTPIPQIQILIEQPANTYIKVYDSFGKLVSEKYISSMGQIINYSDLPRGIYHAVLVKNGEIVEKQSLAKM